MKIFQLQQNGNRCLSTWTDRVINVFEAEYLYSKSRKRKKIAFAKQE